MARHPARAEPSGPGPLPAVVGGVAAALVLYWLVGIVIGTFVFAVKLLVLLVVLGGGYWAYRKVRSFARR